MNKLVSKNPVLRFKLGRKIVKAQHGWGKYPGVPGLLSDYMYRMTYPSDTPLPGGMYLDNYDGSIYSTRFKYPYEEPTPISSPKVIQNGTYYETKDSSGKVIDRGRYFGGKKHSLPIGSSSSNKQSLEKVLTTEASEKKLPLNKSNSQKTLSTGKKISFKQTFNTARNSGKQEFIWNGKRFNTKNKGEENYVFLNGKWIAPSVLLPNVNLSELKTPIVSSITPINNQEVANLKLNVPTYVTADRSQTRDWMRSNDINPYSVTGAMRAAIRRIRAGQATDNDKLLVKGNEQLYNLLKGYYKKGGNMLPSRNIVKRFKLQKGNKFPNAPKAEDRFKNGVKDSVAYLGVPGKDNTYFGESIKRVSTPENAKILRQVLFRHSPYDNDTIYTEVPEHTKRLPILPPVNIIPRKGFSFAQTPEYEVLKRRFNTAWNLAK